uniref:Apple domain-containing protein n=1 Tax=Globodera pallida TaxID=36090 RepID=A0A183BN35_GLOPA
MPTTLLPRTEVTTLAPSSSTTTTTTEIAEETNSTEIGVEENGTATSMLFSQSMEMVGDVRAEADGNGTEKVIKTTGEAKIETITKMGNTADEAKEADKTPESTTIADKIPTLPILIRNEHAMDREGRPKSVGVAVPSETKPTEATQTTEEAGDEGEDEVTETFNQKADGEANETKKSGEVTPNSTSETTTSVTTKAADQPISERRASINSQEKVEQQEETNSTSSSSTEEPVTPMMEQQQDETNVTSSSSTEESVTPMVEQQEDETNATSSSSTEEPTTLKVEQQQDETNVTSSSSTEEPTTPKMEQQQDETNATSSSSTEEPTTPKMEQQEDETNATSSSSTEEPTTLKVEQQGDETNATSPSSTEEPIIPKIELQQEETNSTSSSSTEEPTTPKMEQQEDETNATSSSSTEEPTTPKMEQQQDETNATSSSSTEEPTTPSSTEESIIPKTNVETESESTTSSTQSSTSTSTESVDAFSPSSNVSEATENTTILATEEASEDVVDAVSKLVDIMKTNSGAITPTEPTLEAVSSIAKFIGGQNASAVLGFGVKDCAGDFEFSGQLLKDYTQSFEVILAAETVYDCVRDCFQQNCSRAAFTHFPRSVCLMHFGGEKPLDQKCSDGDRLHSNWEFSSVPEVVQILCVKCVGGNKESVEKNTDSEQNIAKRQFSNDENGVEPAQHQRHIFVALPVSDLQPLNITNDVPADTAADCARKCFEVRHCSLAAFIPTPGHESSGGICLLTADSGDVACGGTSARHTPQHASTVPFLIKCIRCSNCHYALTLLNAQSAPLVQADDHFEQAEVWTVGECAERCAGTNCSRAQFDPNKSMCSFSTKNVVRTHSSECPPESGLQTDGIFPLLLDCVKCFSNSSTPSSARNS